MRILHLLPQTSLRQVWNAQVQPARGPELDDPPGGEGPQQHPRGRDGARQGERRRDGGDKDRTISKLNK